MVFRDNGFVSDAVKNQRRTNLQADVAGYGGEGDMSENEKN
jgi:hypothetical protein